MRRRRRKRSGQTSVPGLTRDVDAREHNESWRRRVVEEINANRVIGVTLGAVNGTTVTQ